MRANAARRTSRTVLHLVRLRAGLIRVLRRHPSWGGLEEAIAAHLRAHFAANPPRLQQIDLSVPSAILRQIVRYEAVHQIGSLRDLRRRLQIDRRCYALFSPSMPGEPLVFTELALTQRVVTDVGTILDADAPLLDPEACTCAMFYSISSCHAGLRGVPFGGLLIRMALDRLQREYPRVRTFATVSPVPGFRAWLSQMAATQGGTLAQIVASVDDGSWLKDSEARLRVQFALMPLCASYLLDAKRGAEPLDPVARFHLGNGARLERINWLGDRSAAGMSRSAGFTANYVYDSSEIDVNEALYHQTRAVRATPAVKALAYGVSGCLA